MKAIDNIVNKLINNAEKQAQDILNDAKNQAKNIRDEKIGKANREKDEILNKANIDAKNLYNSIIQHSNIRSRDEANTKKLLIIDEVFKKAKDRLINLGKDEYIDLLKDAIKNYEAPFTIYIPKKKKIGKLGNKDIKVINDDKVESGFVIEKGKIRYNYDFTKVIDFRRDDLEKEVIKILNIG